MADFTLSYSSCNSTYIAVIVALADFQLFIEARMARQIESDLVGHFFTRGRKQPANETATIYAIDPSEVGPLLGEKW